MKSERGKAAVPQKGDNASSVEGWDYCRTNRLPSPSVISVKLYGKKNIAKRKTFTD